MGYTLVTSYCILLESRNMCITLVSFSEESNKSGGISGSQSFQSWGSYAECLSITHDCKPSTAINHWSTCAYHKLGTEARSFNYATNKDHSWWELGCWPPGAELYIDLWAVEASVSKGLYCSCLWWDLWNSQLVLLLQSQAEPSEIMMEVLKALRELDIVWKSIGAYSVRCRWVPPLPNLSKSCNWSAGNSYSESPMTLGSFPLSEMSLQANGVMLDDNELGDQFLVRFEVQVRQSSIFSPCFLFDNLLACFWKCFAGQWNLWVEGNYIAVLISLTLGNGHCSFSRQGKGSICWTCNE
jgi:hypothetical protein